MTISRHYLNLAIFINNFTCFYSYPPVAQRLVHLAVAYSARWQSIILWMNAKQQCPRDRWFKSDRGDFSTSEPKKSKSRLKTITAVVNHVLAYLGWKFLRAYLHDFIVFSRFNAKQQWTFDLMRIRASVLIKLTPQKRKRTEESYRKCNNFLQ